MLRQSLRNLTKFNNISYATEIYNSKMINQIKNVKIVDSTLREGEQFISCNLKTHEKLKIADMLYDMHIDYIELTSPIVSKSSYTDCKEIVKNRRNGTKVLTHVRCHKDDVDKALECGVHGINMYMATSEILSKYSHKKGIEEVIKMAVEMITYIKSHNVEVRFSCEDSFRSNLDDILKIYTAVVNAGVNRIGIADTVGIADAYIVSQLLQHVRTQLPNTDIEFHAHNDTGSANENAFTALRHGATHIDVTVLGIGERNGITQLGAFLSKMCAVPEALEITKNRYNLSVLSKLEKYVASICGIEIPYNNPITGTAFIHKAGVHSNAAISNPKSYEILDPEIFGMKRSICIASKMTGKNAIKQRAKELNIYISDLTLQKITSIIKNIFDTKEPDISIVDNILYLHRELKPSSILIKTTTEPYIIIKLVGHLFDNGIIDKITDICTHNNVLNYEIESYPGLKFDIVSTSFIRIESNRTVLDNVLHDITNYINRNDDKCTLEVMTDI